MVGAVALDVILGVFVSDVETIFIVLAGDAVAHTFDHGGSGRRIGGKNRR